MTRFRMRSSTRPQPSARGSRRNLSAAAAKAAVPVAQTDNRFWLAVAGALVVVAALGLLLAVAT